MAIMHSGLNNERTQDSTWEEYVTKTAVKGSKMLQQRRRAQKGVSARKFFMMECSLWPTRKGCSLVLAKDPTAVAACLISRAMVSRPIYEKYTQFV